jgi:hypothetical protein
MRSAVFSLLRCLQYVIISVQAGILVQAGVLLRDGVLLQDGVRLRDDVLDRVGGHGMGKVCK